MSPRETALIRLNHRAAYVTPLDRTPQKIYLLIVNSVLRRDTHRGTEDIKYPVNALADYFVFSAAGASKPSRRSFR